MGDAKDQWGFAAEFNIEVRAGLVFTLGMTKRVRIAWGELTR